MRFIITFISFFLLAPIDTQAHEVIVVGVEPAMLQVALDGVEGWYDAGIPFVVQATGCGSGDVSFCYSDNPWAVGLGTAQIAWYIVGGDVIYVSTVSDYAFIPPTVAHELGHWLGLHYHSTDPSSCMFDPSTTSIYPSDEDLANL